MKCHACQKLHDRRYECTVISCIDKMRTNPRSLIIASKFASPPTSHPVAPCLRRSAQRRRWKSMFGWSALWCSKTGSPQVAHTAGFRATLRHSRRRASCDCSREAQTSKLPQAPNFLWRLSLECRPLSLESGPRWEENNPARYLALDAASVGARYPSEGFSSLPIP